MARRAWLMGLVLAAIVVAVAAMTREVYDDPWILYRYAENLAHGEGWTFNPGESTANAVSSPLTVLLLAVITWTGIPMSVASAILFVLGMWSAGCFLYLAFRTLGWEVAGIVSAVLMVTSPVLISFRGMESPVALGLLSLAGFLACLRREVASGAVFGLIIVARPDFAVAIGVFAIFALVLDWRRSLRAAIAASVVVAIWVGLAVILLGSPLPSTLDAKIAQAQSGVWPTFAEVLLGFVSWPSEPGRQGAMVIAVIVGVVFALVRRQWEVIALLSGVLVWMAAFVTVGIAFYPWYLALPAYGCMIAAGAGGEAVARVFSNVVRGRYSTVGIAAVGVWLLATVVVGLAGDLVTMSPPRMQYAEVAAWLREHTASESTVSAVEVGRLGFLSQRRMVDPLGLLDARGSAYVRSGDWAWAVRTHEPDYVVLTRAAQWPVEASVAQDPGFAATYLPVFSTENLDVYQRTA